MDILVHASLREGLARALPQALIAGKPPETRVDQLRRFWTRISTPPPWGGIGETAATWWGQPAELLPGNAASLAG